MHQVSGSEHRLETAFSPVVDSGLFPTVAVVEVSDATVRAAFLGIRADDADENTLFEIGSITKTFTGILLADMVVRGEVSLDSPVSGLMTSAGSEITLLDLATHSAGLPGNPEEVERMAEIDHARIFATFTLDDMDTWVAEHGLRLPAEAPPAYSNLGFGLLGHVLAQRAGTSFADLVTERILRPLGMNESTLDLPDSPDVRVAQGHGLDMRSVAPLEIPGLGAAGAIRSTLHDMSAYMSAVISPGETPLEDAIRLAIRPQKRIVFDDYPQREFEIGLGWLIESRDDRAVLWHDGGTPGFRSFLAVGPAAKHGVVALANAWNESDVLDECGWSLFDDDPAD